VRIITAYDYVEVVAMDEVNRKGAVGWRVTRVYASERNPVTFLMEKAREVEVVEIGDEVPGARAGIGGVSS